MDSGKTRIGEALDAFQRNDYVTVRDLCLPLAATGSMQALILLGSIYEWGSAAVPRDYKEARRWYELAWKNGTLALAALKLGHFYYHGYGTDVDYNKAYFYYSKLENSKDPVGLLRLGLLYEMGRGVTKDVYKARTLFRRATRLGNIQARKNWGMLELKYGNPLLGILLWGWALMQGIPLIFINRDDSRLRSY